MQYRSSVSLSSHLSGEWILGLAAAGVGALIFAPSLTAQNPPANQPAPTPPAPKETVHDGYTVHQSVDMGGRISNENGNPGMYDTLVNMHSGPRILQQSLEMRAAPGAGHFFLFDSLLLTNTGYGGDPENVTLLRMSKGKAYA